MDLPLDHQHTIPLALTGGGDMGEKIRALDWTKTTLGPLDRWPKTLHSALSICINSDFPIALICVKGPVLQIPRGADDLPENDRINQAQELGNTGKEK